MSTPVAGPLVVTPVFATAGDILVEWDDVGDTWRSIATGTGGGGSTTVTLTGDVTGTGTGTVPTTLATVNANVGTFQGITVNAKGLVTAAANQSYLTTNQTITLSGDLSGSGTTSINAQIAANAVGTTEIANANVTYAKIQNVANNRILGNTSGSAAAPSEIVLPLSVANGGTGSAAPPAYLPLTGGTVSGATTFQGTVTFSGTTSPAWLPLTGGTLSGALTVTGGDLVCQNLSLSGAYSIGINGVPFATGDALGIGFTKIQDNSGNITFYLGNNTSQQTNIYAQTQHQFTNRTAGATWALFDATNTRNVSGAWAVISDPAMKEDDVAPYTRGLEAVLALEPVLFRYRAGTPSAPEDQPSRPLMGLMADQVQPHVPEIVGRTTATVKGADVEVDTLEPGNLIYACINAIKELSAKVAALEARIAV